MQRVEEPMETIHVYVVRHEEPRPSSLLPLVCACLCLVGIVALTLYSGQHPSLAQQTVRVRAVVLPLQTFTASVKVLPTGVKTSPATHATGTLTLTNGSVVSQELPTGMLFPGTQGVEVVTDTAVWVPAGSVAGYGRATVSAHVITPGINLAPLAVNQVLGTSLFVRNLSAFTGGRPASSVTFITPQDRVRAIAQARQALALHTLSRLLLRPCHETMTGNITLTWQCQFVTYHVPSFMRVISVRLQGKDVLVEVVYVVRPKPFQGK
jgi:hypothetical protein